ncbi:PKD domain-containing protein [Candidatus Parabeggiatoa sp. HSG14]|uniref:InlB B-repeat-containing protein n=1 Tax=Candidatus Parabeggiatoa sp. HSG14 TaxID=3055593 RepID=UPI0025A7EBBE|nr:PKD domain-containing protein [Thiotrichales bacterium HSG14]
MYFYSRFLYRMRKYLYHQSCLLFVMLFGFLPSYALAQENQSPIVAFTVSPSQGKMPLIVTLDASDSYDPDGSITDYEWSIGKEIEYGNPSTHLFNDNGNYAITLTVTDNQGLTTSGSKSIVITDPDSSVSPESPTKPDTPEQVKLTININGTGIGDVTGSGIECGSDCSGQYAKNAKVTLTAKPDVNSTFTSWSGGCSGTKESCTVTMTQAKSVTATFKGPSKGESIVTKTDCNARICDADGKNCHRISSMPVAECETLLALYHSTDGSQWRNKKNWNTTNEPRNFALINTNKDGNVVSLNLRNNGLTGVLPDLSNLTSLKEINLWSNELTGPIPDLSALSNLEKISFYHNTLCGQIPDLSALTNTTRIDFSENQLTGPIPALSALDSSKTFIALNGNKLCQDKNTDYTGFEKTVDKFPLCTEEDEYPSCAKYVLIINKAGSGSGKVTGEGIDCGSDCNEVFAGDIEIEVTLTAKPTADSVFVGWNGACSGEEESCQITINQSQNVTAIFNLIEEGDELAGKYRLTINKNGNGTGNVIGEGIDCGSDCSEQYAENTEVTLTAEPIDDSIFESWNGACSGTKNTCQITMTETQNVTATFSQESVINEYVLTVNSDGGGTGRVTGSGIDCGTVCNKQYVKNTLVTLQAEPSADSIFVGWTNACSGANICQVSMTEAQNVTAIFNIVSTFYPLTISKNGNGSGTVVGEGIDCGMTCAGQYAENWKMQLTAIPDSSSSFAGWAGACSGNHLVCQVSITQAVDVTATFNLMPLNQPDLEFVGLKEFYQVGEWFMLDLVEHLQIPPSVPRVDLWIAVEAPDNLFYFMTELPLEPFSLTPQPYRQGIAGSELVDIEVKYHLLSFDVPPGRSGTYQFYAIYNQAETDLSNMLKTQQSNLAYATTVFSSGINPSILWSPPAGLTMLIGEELEVVVDSEMTYNAILSTCAITPLNIVESKSAQSRTGNGVSCYLKALKSGDAILTTTDRNGYTTKTLITVR